jgi:hypothetical protein
MLYVHATLHASATLAQDACNDKEHGAQADRTSCNPETEREAPQLTLVPAHLFWPPSLEASEMPEGCHVDCSAAPPHPFKSREGKKKKRKQHELL